MKYIPLHIDEDVYRDLRSLAERAGRPVAEVIREAMSEYLTRRQGNRVSIFELRPHPSGAQLREWRREELLDEMYLATVDSEVE